MNTYVVSRELLEQNLRQLKKQANGVPIWAVIKGDGYGIGALPLAELLADNGIEHFCITEVREAELLRENGFREAQILMLRSISDRETLHRLLDLDVILTVGSWEVAQEIDALARERADIAEVHIKIDTGMGRYGFLPSETERVIALYREMKHLAIGGIYTHFNCAYGDEKLTRQEFTAFQEVVAQLRAAGLETGIVHCCNSSAFLKYPEMHCDAVRLGSAILGRMPFRTKLRPVGYMESEIEALRTLPKGHSTGYGAVWTAKRETQLAIVPVGWYHGFHVSCRYNMTRASDRFVAVLAAFKRLLRKELTYVEIGGKQCPVVGAIGMLHCAVDVTGMSCAVGDRVILQVNPLHQKGVKVAYRK